MSDIARLGGEWAAKAQRADTAEGNARYRARGRVLDDVLTDWHALVAIVRERDEAWTRLRDAVEADEERKRIKAEAER